MATVRAVREFLTELGEKDLARDLKVNDEVRRKEIWAGVRSARVRRCGGEGRCRARGRATRGRLDGAVAYVRSPPRTDDAEGRIMAGMTATVGGRRVRTTKCNE
jgi:hypothetical protein